ncbi:MAG: hypothetical protein HPY53_01050 [Brevinematales bacterium]|nr:hypothetical protein [Brevinematales bacterium]
MNIIYHVNQKRNRYRDIVFISSFTVCDSISGIGYGTNRYHTIDLPEEYENYKEAHMLCEEGSGEDYRYGRVS